MFASGWIDLTSAADWSISIINSVIVRIHLLPDHRWQSTLHPCCQAISNRIGSIIDLRSLFEPIPIIRSRSISLHQHLGNPLRIFSTKTLPCVPRKLTELLIMFPRGSSIRNCPLRFISIRMHWLIAWICSCNCSQQIRPIVRRFVWDRHRRSQHRVEWLMPTSSRWRSSRSINGNIPSNWLDDSRRWRMSINHAENRNDTIHWLNNRAHHRGSITSQVSSMNHFSCYANDRTCTQAIIHHKQISKTCVVLPLTFMNCKDTVWI